MDRPTEPEPGPRLPAGIAQTQAAVQAASAGDRRPTLSIEKEISAEDLEEEIEAPMVGVLPGFGKFQADARIYLTENNPGEPLAELLIAGTTTKGESLSIALPLLPVQTKALVNGQKVKLDIPGGLSYGEVTKHVRG